MKLYNQLKLKKIDLALNLKLLQKLQKLAVEFMKLEYLTTAELIKKAKKSVGVMDLEQFTAF
ncbi:hypothetical protein PROH_14585 [Prochlorothrix hollandica PCC 9006 = CALU 1027]|uniref:Uncharacterized protein n=1 Tax=Prochlorothrix hollandica PCC 9006 = CALU 1027 TaxID=317619 RepID=A0A0M2PR86_PROHO|nr:hypothetical protein PROH_14585 [Prochlorothrix hollandica PCC 9006 = CALU 1027]